MISLCDEPYQFDDDKKTIFLNYGLTLNFKIRGEKYRKLLHLHVLGKGVSRKQRSKRS